MVAKASSGVSLGFLQTRRLSLRRAAAGDVAALHEMMADAEVMRFWSTPPHATIAETERFLANMLAAAAAGTSEEFVVEFNATVIGKIGVWRASEIGFFFARPYWGQGLAREALDRFMAYYLATPGSYLVADVDPRNENCLKLLTSAGFVETGRASATIQIAETWYDSVYLRRDTATLHNP